MSSSILIDETGSYENLPDVSKAYYIKDGQTLEFSPALIRRIHIAPSAGGILASSQDMVKYMQFQLNGGRVGNKQVIPKV